MSMSEIIQRIYNALHFPSKKRRSLDNEPYEHSPKQRKLHSTYDMDPVAAPPKYSNAFVPRDGPDPAKQSNIPTLSLRKNTMMPHLHKRRTNGFPLLDDDDDNDDDEIELNHHIVNNISSTARPEYTQPAPAKVASGRGSANMPPPPLVRMPSRFTRPPVPSLRKITTGVHPKGSYGLQSSNIIGDVNRGAVESSSLLGSGQRRWTSSENDNTDSVVGTSYAAALRNGLGGGGQAATAPPAGDKNKRPTAFWPHNVTEYKGLLDRLKNQQSYLTGFARKKPPARDPGRCETIDLVDNTTDYSRNVPLSTINLTGSVVSLLDDDDSVGIEVLANHTANSCRVPVAALSSMRLNESNAAAEPKLPPVNSLQAKLDSKPEFQSSYLEEVNQRYANRQKSLQNQLEAANTTVQQQVEEARRQERLYRERQTREWQVRDAPIIVLEPEEEEEEEFNDFPAFTADQRALIGDLMRPHPAAEVLINKFGIQIKRNDIQTLEGLNWLNDEVINFYMNLLAERSSLCPDLPKVYAFSTFFLTRLSSSGYSGVRRWTRKVEIFKYDLIPVPVHVSGVHWCMAIIDFRHKTIRFYDSMISKNPHVLKVLADWLVEEHRDKQGSDYDLTGWTYESMVNIPRQGNSSDCGVFSCAFAETIARNRPILFSQKNMPYLRRKMVLEICTGKMLL